MASYRTALKKVDHMVSNNDTSSAEIYPFDLTFTGAIRYDVVGADNNPVFVIDLKNLLADIEKQVQAKIENARTIDVVAVAGSNTADGFEVDAPVEADGIALMIDYGSDM